MTLASVFGKSICIAVLVFFLAFCVIHINSALHGSEETSKAQLEKEDNWQRIKACSVQADQMVKRNGWQKGQLADGKYLFSEVTFLESQSHYSPKYKSCYLHATFFTSKAPSDRISFYHLYDAFEGRLLAICSDGLTPRSKFFCSIEEKAISDSLLNDGERQTGNCEACKRFVADRWNN